MDIPGHLTAPTFAMFINRKKWESIALQPGRHGLRPARCGLRAVFRRAGGQGWRVQFLPAWTEWPTDDPVTDAALMNRFIDDQIRKMPAQTLWVHKRFKTRPPGEAPIY